MVELNADLMNYYEYIAIDADDQTIACHPLIDACDARILFEVIRHLGFDLSGRNALDVGAGTGQVSRLLLGLPSLTVEALDSDPEAQRYFAHHPELGSVRFHVREVIRDGLPQHYDLVVARGVYHHIPKKDRPAFLRALCTRSQLTIIADEGLLEYSSAAERVQWNGRVGRSDPSHTRSRHRSTAR